MEPHDNQEHLRPLSGLTDAELRARLRKAAREAQEASEANPDQNKQTLGEYLNEQSQAEQEGIDQAGLEPG